MGSALDRLAQEAAKTQGVTETDPQASLRALADSAEARAQRFADRVRNPAPLPPAPATPAPAPSRLDQLKQFIETRGPEALHALASGLAAPLTSFADAFISPVQGERIPVNAKVGRLPGSLAPGTVITAENTPGAVPRSRVYRAMGETAANAFAGAAGGFAGNAALRAGASPLISRLTAAAVGGALPGAAYAPEHPVQGALTGAALGLAGHALMGRAPAEAPEAGAVAPGSAVVPVARPTVGEARFSPAPPALGGPAVGALPPADVPLRLPPGPRSIEAGGAAAPGANAEYRFSVGGLTPEQKSFLGEAYRGALVEPFPALHGLDDAPLRAALLEKGAAGAYGKHAANYYDALTNDIPAPKRSQFEQSVLADNMAAQATKMAAKGQSGAAGRLTQLAAKVRGTLPKDVTADPAYAGWLQRYKAVIEPEFERVAKASGLPKSQFRQLGANSAYVPLPGELEAGTEGYTYRPPSKGGPRTKQSGAVFQAVGGGNAPADFKSLIGSHMAARQAVAANNAVIEALRAGGRPLSGAAAPLEAGESRLAFDDAHHIVTPESEQARHFVAVPERYAQALATSDARLARQPPTTALGKIGRGITRGVTGLETKLAPVVLPIHARNIAETVGSQSGGALRDIATAVTPEGHTLSGIARMSGVDFRDPEVARRMLSLARYGGLRTAEDKPGLIHAAGRALFNTTGVDPRGRAALAEMYQSAHPEASPAEVAQHVTGELGNYVGANQPEGVRFLQRTGATSFAPAATAFTRGGIRRLALGGEGTLGARLGRMARTVGPGLSTLEAANYLTSGHSTFSNPAGHRLDVDVGTKGPEGGHEYIGLSAVDPLLSRALNQTGARGLIEGEGLPGMARRAVNATLAHLGVAPRAALALGLNAEPYLTREGIPGLASPPQFSQGKQIAGAVRRAAGGVTGAAGALSGSTPYSATQSVPERLMAALGAPVPYEDYRTAPHARNEPSGFRDKTSTAVGAIYRAGSAAERRQVMRTAIEDARAAGYDAKRMQELRRALSGAARRAGAAKARP